MDTDHSKCYGVGKFRSNFTFIRNLTGGQQYRSLDRSSHNQALTLVGMFQTNHKDYWLCRLKSKYTELITGSLKKKFEAGTGSLVTSYKVFRCHPLNIMLYCCYIASYSWSPFLKQILPTL